MLPQKPYLVRAYYEWIVDSNCTPYLLVDATVQGAELPQEYVEDGEIVLDISAKAVTQLNISNHKVEFQATFGGIPKSIVAPMRAILAVYANENGRGMVFNLEEDGDDDPFPEEEEGSEKSGKGTGSDKKKPPHLKLVE